MPDRLPNVIICFGDQWRAQATGYAGDPNVRTPHLDRLAGRSVNCTNAVSGCPICSPYRASLTTGRYPLTHGVFVNDVHLSHDAVSLADAFKRHGYQTAWIGKWHLQGRGRASYIPPEDRQGFGYWKVLECTHDYNQSFYYAGDSDRKQLWQGYDAEAQTRDAVEYIRGHGRDAPFLLGLSWGPPHNPYHTAPPRYRDMYDPDRITLPPNVPPETEEYARKNLAGYYAHCTALDDCAGRLVATLAETGQEENTLLVFTSDHGDMVGSQGLTACKQSPWEESIRVPLLFHWPAGLEAGGETDAVMDAPDIMPTLLGLCGLEIPETVEGRDFSGHLRGGPDQSDGSALLASYHPFADWCHERGGREFRGVRTRRHTWVRTLDGAWLLFDNEADPFQLENLVNRPETAELQARLDALLKKKLAEQEDAFEPGRVLMERWGYPIGPAGAVPYTD